MSWHPRESGLFRYATHHEAEHARALMAKNNPAGQIREVVESPMPFNMKYPCPNKGKEGRCPLDK